MGLRFQMGLRGMPPDYAKLHEEALARAQTLAIQRGVATATRAGRTQIERALGPRIAKAFRSFTVPRRGQFQINPRGGVFSKAIVKRPGGIVDLFTAFDRGAVVTVRGA